MRSISPRETPVQIGLTLATSGLLLLASPGLGIQPLLAWIALVPLLVAIKGQSARRAALLGLLSGLAYFLPLLSFIVTVLATYGQVAPVLACAALLFLALYMSVYPALFSFLLAKNATRLPLLFFGPILWVSLDLIRTHLFTGFPWLDLGYTQYNVPGLIQIADLTGHYGVSFLIVLMNTTLFHLINRGIKQRPECPPRLIAAAVLLLGLAAGYNHLRQAAVEQAAAKAESIGVAVIQGNIAQDQKWQVEVQNRTIETYLRLSGQALAAAGQNRPELIVWPETAIPFYPYEHILFQTIGQQLIRPFGVALLSGAPHRQWQNPTDPPTYSNSAFLVGPDGRVLGRYDKQHLVPFGEYIPFRGLLSFASPVVETLGDFAPGRLSPPILYLNSRIGILICFESIFPEVARKEAAEGANLLVNLTNDAWFGSSGAPRQHLAMAVFRAVETRKSLVRSANTGISALISPSGRIESPSPLFVEYHKQYQVALLEGQSGYVRFGYLFPFLCLLLSLATIFFSYLPAKKPILGR